MLDPILIPIILIGALCLTGYAMHRVTIPRRKYLMRGKLILIKGGKYEAPKRLLSTYKL